MNPPAHVVVFAKAPVAGLAKTRLIPALGPQGAANLARRMLSHAVQQAVAARLGSVELCVTPDTLHPEFEQLAQRHGLALTHQGPGDLGARMHNAFNRVLQDHPAALLLGTDAPAVDATVLAAAARALKRADAVFVPAHDGGYALVGLRKACPDLFQDIAWSTPDVMAQTRRKALAAHIRWHELAVVHDIDEPVDLVHVPKGWVLPAARHMQD